MREIKLAIGQTSEGTAFTLPPQAVTETFAILAKRGMGKTYSASVLAEEFLKFNLPVCVADPVGVWWGLRASADGKGPGLPIVVLGGDHGDLPLDSTAGSLIADLIIDERLPAVLDLSLFRKGEQNRFMTDFCERLYHKNRQPLHLILDEADAFAPQRPMKGQERLLGAVEDLVRRGRARGLGVTLVTQRAAVINKDVLTQAEVLVCLRTIAPQDREAVDAWIRVHGTPEQREELMTSLPSLPIGTAWFWSPGWLDTFERVQIRKRETFDSSATPKIGGKVQSPKRLADVDIARLQERLSSFMEQTEAQDPAALRRRIATLEKEMQKRQPETVVERVVEVPVLKDGQLERIELAVREMVGMSQRLTQLGQDLSDCLAMVSRPGAAVVTTPTPPNGGPKPGNVRDHYMLTEPSSDSDTIQLRAGERRILDALARRYPLKFTRSQLATISGFSTRSGTYSTYLGTLRRNGLMEEANGEATITQAGLDYLGYEKPPAPQTTEETLNMWRGSLRAGERKMFDALVEVYPHSLTREQLAEMAGFSVSSGTFSTYLGTLRRNGLMEENGKATRAASALFIN